ncbi:endo-1,4-beta-xylanase [Sphaerisporangium aureirubrum]|uniref:Beta-xylanase n=1 Tax=Sphaerisporangium aureirubrum TaxID=1544736 RepID=A0ABW1NMX9_9ACTN
MIIDVVRPLHRFLVVVAAGVVAVALAVVPSSPAAADSTLGGAAARSGRYFGAAVQARYLGEAAYTTVLDREFTSVTPELEMWWEVLQPSRGVWNFAPADRIVEYAQARGMTVRGRLVASYGIPNWVTSLGSASDVNAALVTFITTVMRHFQGKVATWDVVGEAFADTSTSPRRPGIFQSRLGDSWIEQAFRAARAADPQTRLCYNDYGIEDVAKPKTQAVLALVRDFKTRGVPLDCVGLESHFDYRAFPSPPNFRPTLQQFAAYGVDVHMTELDVSDTASRQAEIYRSAVSSCVAVPRCKGITVWGIPDHYSWRSGSAPLLFDRYYNKKPAYAATLAGLGMWVTSGGS